MSRSLRFNRDWPPEYGIVCVWQRKSAHAPNIVILLPLYASPTTYKMTPSVKVLHQQTVHQSAPPRCRWAVCVCCVRTSAAHAQVCACELACWIGFSDPGGGREEEQLGVADKQDVSHSFSWLELPGERSLIVDTEKEHCVISPLWPMTCLETSRESSYVIGGNDPDTTKLDFWRNSWLLCLFLCLFEPDPTVFLTDSCKHVIVLTQIRSWNDTQQTLGMLLSG